MVQKYNRIHALTVIKCANVKKNHECKTKHGHFPFNSARPHFCRRHMIAYWRLLSRSPFFSQWANNSEWEKKVMGKFRQMNTTHTSTHKQFNYKHAYKFIYIYTYIDTNTYKYVYTYIHLCLYVNTYIKT